MICFKLLPRNIDKCIELSEAPVSLLLESIKDLLDENLGVIVVVNGKPLNNYDEVVSSKDEVVIVEESLGG